MADKRNLMLSDIFKYTSAQYFSQFLGFFTSIFLRKFLGPFYTGVWNFLRIILDYGSYTNLGTTSTIAYKYPMLKGAKRNEEADRLVSCVFSFSIITTILYSICIWLYAFGFHKKLDKLVFIGFLIVGIILLVQRIYTFYIVFFRANRDFSILSKVIIFDAIVNLGLTIIVISKLKLIGLYFVAMLMPILNVIFIRKYLKYNFKFSFYLKGISQHIKYGFPLFIVGILNQILYSIDRIMIVTLLDFKQLGYYSLAIMAKSYSVGIGKNFSIVIQPYFMENVGKEGITKSSREAMLYSELAAYFMAILLSFVFIAAKPFVEIALPKFTNGIMAMRIFLLGTFFYSIIPYLSNMVVAMAKQAGLIFITTIAILVNVFLNFFFIKYGYGINGVAMGTSISTFISFFLVSVYALSPFESSGNIVYFLMKVLFPLLYCTISLLFISISIAKDNLLLDTVMKCGVFSILIIPLIIYIEQKTGIVRLIINKLFRKSNNKDE